MTAGAHNGTTRLDPLGREIGLWRRLATDSSGSGEPVVLIHGLGATRRVWDPVVAELSRHHSVLALDLPGFGESQLKPGAVASIPEQANAVQAELRARGIEHAHLVGNSMGGWVVFELAIRRIAQSLVAIAPAGGWTPTEARIIRLRMIAFRAGAKLGSPFADRLMRSSRARESLMGLTNARGARVPPAAAAAGMRALAKAPGYWSAMRWCLKNPLPELERIDCPVVIAWGSEDRLLPPRHAARFVERIAGARLVELPGVGHAPMADDPALVARTILETTTRQPA